MIAGAFISYTVGAGFASGNEILQFYGSWGLSKAILGIVIATIINTVFCLSLFTGSQYVELGKTSECYTFFGGKIFGTFMKYYVYVLLFCTLMLMFAGAGSILNQMWDLPQWVGSVLMGIIAGVVVLGGLKAVENVLGYVGIVILIYVAIFGIISLINIKLPLDLTGLYQAVDEGKILQTNIFQYPPFNLLPDVVKEHNNALFSGLLYGTLNLVTGFPFYYTLGKRTRNRADASKAAVITSVAFYLCVLMVVIIVVLNCDKIMNQKTGEMFPFPALAVVNSFWPAGGWTYAIIIFAGIFTTVAGYLWVIKDWIFSGDDALNSKSFALIAALILIGIFLGGILPFSRVINIIFPISGVVGMIMTAFLIVRLVKGYDKRVEAAGYTPKSAVTDEAETD